MTDVLGAAIRAIAGVLDFVVTAPLALWHEVLSRAVGSDSVTWTLAIVLAVLTVRAALLPWSVRAVRSSRRSLFVVQHLEELRAAGVDDRAVIVREARRLWREEGTRWWTPLVTGGIALVLLLTLAGVLAGRSSGFLDPGRAEELRQARLVTAELGRTLISASSWSAAAAAIGLIVVLVIVLLLAGRQELAGLPAEVAASANARSRRRGARLLPPLFGLGCSFFPVGVVLAWLVWGLWTLGEQAVVLRTE